MADGMKKKRKRPAKLCGANLVDGSGRTCGHPAGWGTGTGRGRCKKHGGNTPTHVIKAEREELEEAVELFSLSREIEPTEALLEELWRTAAIVRMLDRQIVTKTPEELLASPGLVLWHRQERRLYVAVARVAIAAGIAERQVKLAEQQGALVATAIRGILEDLDVADHPDVGMVVRRHLSVVRDAA